MGPSRRSRGVIADPDHGGWARGERVPAIAVAARTEVGDRGPRSAKCSTFPERALVVTQHKASIYRGGARIAGRDEAAFPEGVVSPHSIWRAHQGAAIYLNIRKTHPRGMWPGFERRERTCGSLCAHRRARGRMKVRHLEKTGFRIARQAAMAAPTSSLAFTFLSRR